MRPHALSESLRDIRPPFPRDTLQYADIHNRIVPDCPAWQHGFVRLKRAELLIDDYIKEGFRYLLQQVQKIETCAFNSALDCLFIPIFRRSIDEHEVEGARWKIGI